MPSTYLPSDFDRTAPVGLIAGRGVYPRLIAEKALAAGIDMRLIAFDGEAAPETIDTFPEEAERPVVSEVTTKRGFEPMARCSALATTRRSRLQLSSVL